MANNTTLNAMTGGDTVADEDIAGVKYQRVKLVDGTAASTALIGGDATNGLDVDVTRVIPGTAATALGKAEDAAHTTGDTGVLVLGVANEAGVALASTDLDYTPIATDLRGIADVKVRQPQFWSNSGTATAVPGTAAAAYIVGDTFGTLITIANAARFTGGGGFINGITFSDGDDLITGLDIYFFHDSVTLAADNAAWSLSDADTDKILFIARLTFFEDLPLNKVNTQLMGISVPYFCTATSLYAAVRIQTAYTLVSTASPKYRFALARD